jgi:tripartite-type tricarboxylate transporter receptor subunit TctC
VDPALGVSTAAEFIALAKSRPGALNYGSAGVATTSHLAMELLKSQAGIDLNHVPYRGELPAIQEVVAGRISAVFGTPAVVNSLAAAGRVKVLGVSTREPDPQAPELAPIGRSVPGFQVEGWYGVLAPSAVPPAIIAKLNSAIGQALADPEVMEPLKNLGVAPKTSSPEQFGALIVEEMQKWRKVISGANIKVD